jgi:hypothetical protein
MRILNAEIAWLAQAIFALRGPHPHRDLTPDQDAELDGLFRRKQHLQRRVDAMAIGYFGLVPNRTLVRGLGWSEGQLAIFRELIRADYDRHAP